MGIRKDYLLRSRSGENPRDPVSATVHASGCRGGSQHSTTRDSGMGMASTAHAACRSAASRGMRRATFRAARLGMQSIVKLGAAYILAPFGGTGGRIRSRCCPVRTAPPVQIFFGLPLTAIPHGCIHMRVRMRISAVGERIALIRQDGGILTAHGSRLTYHNHYYRGTDCMRPWTSKHTPKQHLHCKLQATGTHAPGRRSHVVPRQ